MVPSFHGSIALRYKPLSGLDLAEGKNESSALVCENLRLICSDLGA